MGSGSSGSGIGSGAQGELWDLGLSHGKGGISTLSWKFPPCLGIWEYSWDPAPGSCLTELSPPAFSLAKPPIHSLGFLEFPDPARPWSSSRCGSDWESGKAGMTELCLKPPGLMQFEPRLIPNCCSTVSHTYPSGYSQFPREEQEQGPEVVLELLGENHVRTIGLFHGFASQGCGWEHTDP